MKESDFRKMKVQVERKELSDRVYRDLSPCWVTVYIDQQNGCSYQVDKLSGQYRVAKADNDANEYGPWKAYDKYG